MFACLECPFCSRFWATKLRIMFPDIFPETWLGKRVDLLGACSSPGWHARHSEERRGGGEACRQQGARGSNQSTYTKKAGTAVDSGSAGGGGGGGHGGGRGKGEGGRGMGGGWRAAGREGPEAVGAGMWGGGRGGGGAVGRQGVWRRGGGGGGGRPSKRVRFLRAATMHNPIKSRVLRNSRPTVVRGTLCSRSQNDLAPAPLLVSPTAFASPGGDSHR